MFLRIMNTDPVLNQRVESAGMTFVKGFDVRN